ncbi:hypothetical protein RD792_001834 [Penstemon davidsonii]|uniref:TF-B3 domain-containing protein n=1 Tax=Penstemon davidsonii TaxID=160366 RepID=A0ABR0DQI1_9LAMI|nr:hypothetical protein RD792_001834 [Penstemon davidsonii]
MTMAISQVSNFEPNPAPAGSSVSKSQKKTWDAKRKLAEKRILDLTQNTMNVKEESENMDMLAIGYEAKVNTNIAPLSCVEFSTSVMERAQEFQANLVSKHPSFTKLMLRSHVSGGFWLGLPMQFCREHMPKEDKTMVLVDEDEQAYDTKYLTVKNGLSGGWRGFSLAHELVEGDVLVFQLIEPCKFKVYIIRASKLTEVDGAINLDCHAKPIDADQNKYISDTKKQKCMESLVVNTQKEKDTTILLSDDKPTNQYLDDSANCGTETMEGIKFSESVIKFKDVKSFADFTVDVNGLILDSKIPTHLRKKYYELCCSQNMFLHDNLIEGLNSDLATGIISETINIADAIRADTSVDHLESWDKTLKAFEDLGMVVGFLRARIHRLFTLSNNAQAIIDSKINERNEAVEDMKSLMGKLVNVRELIKKLDAEIEDLIGKKKEHDFVFKEVSGASW